MNTAQDLIPDARVREHLAARLPHWRLEESRLVRRYRTAGWKASLLAAGAVGHLAEAAWHHPDLLVSFGSLEVRLHSHDAGGITARDLALARRIEDLVVWQPGPEDNPLEGTPAGEVEARHVLPDA